ncbi:cullin-1-like isoform X1 [Iris pallida]|uniref:Cullin-1-like isoform X1 n=1 Tax=Iris pallida TaxID=29817 RepID=A0AAX6FIN0_IRIPA|nr:cullin-1-like isoform X1 [Iris pallida]
MCKVQDSEQGAKQQSITPTDYFEFNSKFQSVTFFVICRDITIQYSCQVQRLGVLFGLLSDE